MWAYNLLRTKHFHGALSGNQHPCLLKSRYGKVSDFRTRFHRRRARLARRLRDEILRRFAVLWVNRSTTCLSDRGSSLIYAMASVCSSSVSFGGLPLRGLSWRLAGPSCSHFLIHVETVSRSTG